MSETTELSNIEGAVKWFDPRKGYGFIVGPQGQDIFVHFSVIDQAEGFKTLRDGESVRYSASKGQKGWSATAVKSTRVAVNAPAQAN
jgi:CspA family cold shock protein